jgi:hypothetical protein
MMSLCGTKPISRLCFSSLSGLVCSTAQHMSQGSLWMDNSGTAWWQILSRDGSQPFEKQSPVQLETGFRSMSSLFVKMHHEVDSPESV